MEIAQCWIRNEDFLEARPRKRFTHVVSNPPYIRSGICTTLRDVYKTRFKSFKQRADLYVPFIEHALGLLGPYVNSPSCAPALGHGTSTAMPFAQAFTSKGQLKTIIDFSDVDSF